MKSLESTPLPPCGAHIWPLSVAAYRTLGEAGLIPKNTELLYGIVYQKVSKSPLHSALVRELLRLLGKTSLPGCFISSEQPICCGDSEPEPDIAIIRGEEKDFWREHPATAELVVEVCVSSHDYDRSKLRAYASAGVKECWLVLAPEKQIEIYTNPAEGRFVQRTLRGPGGRLICATVPTFAVDLDQLFQT